MPQDIPRSWTGASAAADESGRSPAALYRERVETGIIRPDPAQERGLARLQKLHDELREYRPAVKRGGGWLARFGFGGAPAEASAPRGLYLFGPVGRGKSMLMDLFFATAPVEHKRRVHFHAFMLDVHARIERERRAQTEEPVAKVAADLAAAATLLCFDEFQVNDIADAMIIERLFRALFEAGSVIVATSNRVPDRLYENGLQRDRFLPFIALLKEQLDVVELDSGRDYRLSRIMGKPVYHTPLGAAAHKALADTFADLTEGTTPAPETLVIMKRELVVPRAAHNVAWFQFEELCCRPCSAADFLAIAERYAAVILEGIPRLSPQQRNEAQRFHILIDTLYEAQTLFVCSAAAPPERLYTAGDGSFEFQRTVSRLMEMQCEEYIANRRPL